MLDLDDGSAITIHLKMTGQLFVVRAGSMEDPYLRLVLAFEDGRRATRWDLDEATRVHPVLVTHISGHHALGNSLALELRGLDDETPDPEGGRLARDAAGREAPGERDVVEREAEPFEDAVVDERRERARLLEVIDGGERRAHR